MSALDLDAIEARARRKITFGGHTSEPAFGTDDDATNTLALVARVRELETTVDRVETVHADLQEKAVQWGERFSESPETNAQIAAMQTAYESVTDDLGAALEGGDQ